MERPLGGGARTALVLAAAATILLFYGIALVVGVLLAAIVLVLVVAMFAAARVGMAGFLQRALKQHAQLVGILGRSFWLRAPKRYHVPLRRPDGPPLFALLDGLSARLDVDPPSEVLLEMHANAWVRLEGYRQGRGRVVLGIGYDLLAGLTEPQVRAVLAHEMAHAKLVRRGLSRWLNKGLGRLAALTGQLTEHADAYRRAKYRSQVGELLATIFDRLTARAARLVATYSRQDEFEADRGAADICGGAVMRASLMRIETLDRAVARLPWSERLARVQLPASFSQWLVAEIDRSAGETAREVVAHAHDPYSTHPSLTDRVNALPATGELADDARPGIELLANPDDVAERLTTEISRVIAEQEQKDTKALARWTRKRVGSVRGRPLQWLSIPFFAVGLVLAITAISDASLSTGLVAGILLAAGAAAAHFGRYRDRAPLPIPAYGTLTNERPAGETNAELQAAEANIAAALEDRTGYGSKKNRVDGLVAHCYAALRDRDYLRAHVAARLALKIDKKSVDAAIGYAVAAGGLGNHKQATAVMPFIKGKTGLKTPNAQWGLAWALVMIEAWDAAEGLLALLLRSQPQQPTFLSLLALAQLNRGKLRSAIRNVERACGIEPSNPHHMKLLIGALLTAGQVRSAERRLRSVGTAADTDVDHMMSRVRLSLMQSRADDARAWARRARTADPRWTVPLGTLFETARLDDDASMLYEEALTASYYPEAYVGLGRIAAHRGDREAARRHLLSALNLERTIPPKAASSVSLFPEIIARLRELEERRVTCAAWLAAFPAEGKPAPLAGHSVFVCAPDLPAAQRQVQDIVSAMLPGARDLDVSTLAWTEAPKEQQPVRPVHPGIQSVI